MLEKLVREDPEKYATFWNEFGTAFKEGLAEDAVNREKIASLLRFNSTRSAGFDQDRSLQAYLDAAEEGQQFIYYLVAESPTAARGSPHLEALRERGLEVLLLSDRIDEWILPHLQEFGGKSLRDVSRGSLDEGSEATAEASAVELTKEQKSLVKRVKRVLRGRVDEVRISRRLRESAACLVFAEDEPGAHMRELLKAVGQELPSTAPSLEINDRHPLVLKLAAETRDTMFDALAQLLLDEALLLEGQPVEDPGQCVRRINELLLADVPGGAP
jgi:molecular chaperone HtpG